MTTGGSLLPDPGTWVLVRIVDTLHAPGSSLLGLPAAPFLDPWQWLPPLAGDDGPVRASCHRSHLLAPRAVGRPVVSDVPSLDAPFCCPVW